MSFKKLALAGGVAASLMATTAYASVIDRPFFQVLGVVVVWGGTDFQNSTTTDSEGNVISTPGQAPVVSDFVLLTPAPVTGETTGGTFTDGGTAGVLDAADTLTAFGINAETDISGGLVGSHNSSFYVASNAAFDIFAQSSNVLATGDFLLHKTRQQAAQALSQQLTALTTSAHSQKSLMVAARQQRQLALLPLSLFVSTAFTRSTATQRQQEHKVTICLWVWVRFKLT